MSNREEHHQQQENEAKRSLENMNRRWPQDPNVFRTLLIVVLLVIIFLAWFS